MLQHLGHDHSVELAPGKVLGQRFRRSHMNLHSLVDAQPDRGRIGLEFDPRGPTLDALASLTLPASPR